MGEAGEGKQRRDIIVVSTIRGIVDLVQYSMVELHGWGARLPAINQPDRIVLDLDPDEGLGFGRVVEAAFAIRELFKRIGLDSWVKTTGGKGLHVVAPFQPEHDWTVVKNLARALAESLARHAPDAFTATLTKSAREGKIFVDYLRNGEGALSVVPYSARARPGLTVAMPIEWQDLRHVHPADFTVRSTPELLARRRGDPWERLLAANQRLPQALEGLLAQASAKEPSSHRTTSGRSRRPKATPGTRG